MRFLLRRFAVALTVVFALTFLLVGSSLVSARAKQALTGEHFATLRLDTRTWQLLWNNTPIDLDFFQDLIIIRNNLSKRG